MLLEQAFFNFRDDSKGVRLTPEPGMARRSVR